MPLLAAGADDQVGVGLPAGVEVLGDVLDLERVDQLVQRRPARGVLGQQRADGVGDLPPSAVADGEVDRRPRPVAGVLLGLLEDGDRLGRQHLQRAHRAQLPAPARARTGRRRRPR